LIADISLFRPPHITTLYPYTTLFRSGSATSSRAGRAGEAPTYEHVGVRARPAGAVGRGVRRALPPRRAPDRGRVLAPAPRAGRRSEEHTSELQSLRHLVCRLLLEKKN